MNTIIKPIANAYYNEVAADYDVLFTDNLSTAVGAGRSINLTMCNRGWKTLELAGIREDIEAIAISMPGRLLHLEDASSAFQAYGKNGEAIYSINRGELNKKLIDLAEQHGVVIHFNQRCSRVDVSNNTIYIQQEGGGEQAISCDLLFGAMEPSLRYAWLCLLPIAPISPSSISR